MTEKPVQLADIARLVGVTKTTVSLALKGHPRISDKTRAKIEKLAVELGYEPNPAAQALCRKRHQPENSRIIGTMAMLIGASHDRILNPRPEVKKWDELLIASCLRLGYRLEQFVVGPTEKEQQTLSRILKARGVRAVLIYGENAGLRNWKLDWGWFAAVAFSSAMREHFVHNVMSSSYQDVYDAIVRLKQRGYGKPGYFISDRDVEHWQIGFMAASNLLGKSAKQAICTRDLSMPVAAVRDKFCKWFKRYQPDVVVSNYKELFGILTDMGVRMPDNIGYMNLDVREDATEISGLMQMRSAAYKTAAEQLQGMLLRHEYGPPEHPMNIEIPSVWNEGATLRPS